MPGGYGIGAKGTGRCSEMSSSRHLMSQRFITVPRGHVTVRLGTTSWGAQSASLGCLLYLTGSAAVSSLCGTHFCLHTDSFFRSLPLLTLRFWSFGTFSTDHHSFSKLYTTFLLNPQHLNRTNA